MSEQHSEFAVHVSLSTLHSPPPHRPPKQPSEQQSSAFVQTTPSAKQAFVHCTTPACPVTGSQRPLQHCAASVQSVAGPWQGPPGPMFPTAPPPAPTAPPRPAPPSPLPTPAGPPPQDATSMTANRQIEA
jgi:hypothetical protein